MKTIFLLTLAAATAAQAATVVTPYQNSTDGGVSDPSFPYEARTSFTAVDSWDTITGVGGWSYVDLAASADPNTGWGHAASWYLVEISAPTTFHVTLQFNLGETMSAFSLSAGEAGDSVAPGFVIYRGESIDDILAGPNGLHSFANQAGLTPGEVAAINLWDQNSTPLAPVHHAFSDSGTSLSSSVALDPGLYTIAVGNGAVSTAGLSEKIYDLSFATVPEPSVAALGALGGMLLLRRRR